MELKFGKMEIYMMVYGKMIKEMVKELFNGLMVINMQDNGKMTIFVDKE